MIETRRLTDGEIKDCKEKLDKILLLLELKKSKK